MIQALNYCTHAIEVLSKVRNIKDPSFLRFYSPEVLDGYVTALRKSVKFILPPDGELLDVDVAQGRFWDLLLLPYPIIALEFPCAVAPQETDPDVPDATIIMAQSSPQRDEVYVTSFVRARELRPEFKSIGFGRWSPHGFTARIVLHDARELMKKGLRPGFSVYRDTKEVDLGEQEQGTFNIRTLLAFCCTVNCQNVTTEEIAAPKALNKKRQSVNREPFYSCHVLQVPTPRVATNGPSGGNHASPRMHLRRGHLRRLPSQKVIWVRNCIVGNLDRGAVEKDYSLATSAAL